MNKTYNWDEGNGGSKRYYSVATDQIVGRVYPDGDAFAAEVDDIKDSYRTIEAAIKAVETYVSENLS